MNKSGKNKPKSAFDQLQTNKQVLSDDVDSCFRRIVILVNYRERCTQELKYRLVDKEKFNVDVFNKAIDKAVKYNIVNDARYAEIYCFSKISCNRGTDGIEKHLREMKIDISNNKDVQELLNDAKSKEFNTATKFIKNHPSRSKNLYQSYIKKLINRGFSISLSMQVVKAFLNNSS